jgi:hypothetical protein
MTGHTASVKPLVAGSGWLDSGRLPVPVTYRPPAQFFLCCERKYVMRSAKEFINLPDQLRKGVIDYKLLVDARAAADLLDEYAAIINGLREEVRRLKADSLERTGGDRHAPQS